MTVSYFVNIHGATLTIYITYSITYNPKIKFTIEHNHFLDILIKNQNGQIITDLPQT